MASGRLKIFGPDTHVGPAADIPEEYATATEKRKLFWDKAVTYYTRYPDDYRSDFPIDKEQIGNG